jgi:hypothetical protein
MAAAARWTRARALDSVLGTPGAEILATVGLLPSLAVLRRRAPSRPPSLLDLRSRQMGMNRRGKLLVEELGERDYPLRFLCSTFF